MSFYGYHQSQNGYAELRGKIVRINRGGPDSVEGLLYAVESDFLVVLTKDGVVYIPTSHIKSITVKLRSSGGRSSGGTGGQSAGSRGRSSHGRSGMIILAPWFHALLVRLQHQQVQINRGGPEKIEGVISNVTQEAVILVVKNELIRVLIAHIKSVTLPRRTGGKSSGGKSSGGKSSNGKSSNGKSTNGKNTNGQNTNGRNAAQNQAAGRKPVGILPDRQAGGPARKSGKGGQKSDKCCRRTQGTGGRSSHRSSGHCSQGTGGRSSHHSGSRGSRSQVMPGANAAMPGAMNTARQAKGWDPFPMS